MLKSIKDGIVFILGISLIAVVVIVVAISTGTLTAWGIMALAGDSFGLRLCAGVFGIFMALVAIGAFAGAMEHWEKNR